MISHVKWSGLWPGFSIQPRSDFVMQWTHLSNNYCSLSGWKGNSSCEPFTDIPQHGKLYVWGFLLWEHGKNKSDLTFTIESGTSTNTLQCGFYAVRDLLCTIFHSKNHTAIEVLNKKRWKTKDVLEGRTKISKEQCSALFLH